MSMRNLCGLLCTVLLLVGCASGGGLTRQDVFSHYDKVNSLNMALLAAEQQDADILAPEGYAAAKEKLEMAIELARDAKKEKADGEAEEGLRIIDKVNKQIVKAVGLLRADSQEDGLGLGHVTSGRRRKPIGMLREGT